MNVWPDAACLGRTDLFFSYSVPTQEYAKGICHTCPREAECLAGAIARGETNGVWGGEVFEVKNRAGKRCAICQQPFTPAVNSAKWCSDDCRKQGHCDWKREQRRRKDAA